MNLKSKCLLLLSLTVFSTPVLAAENSSLLMSPTKSETVFLLYSKMANLGFNSEEILKNTEAYQKASPVDQAKILTTQKAALEADYAAIDPKEQVIVIRTAVTARAEVSPRPSLHIDVRGDGKPANTVYFPYNWGGRNIAIIPDQLANYLDPSLKVPEATAATAKIRDNSATMVIEMLPLKADNISPMPLDGVQQWLLMTRVVAIAYYTQNMETIWKWQASDYRRSGDVSPLQDLKK